MPVGRPKGQPKTGGRVKGSVNKSKKLRAALVDSAIAAGETPLEFMLKIMRTDVSAAVKKKNPSVALSYATMRFEAAKAAAPYVHSKPAPAAPSRDAPEEYARKIREATEALDASVPTSPGDKR